MANRRGHRRFGYIRKLPSGRWHASYLGPDGRRRAAPNTFDTKTDAAQYLARVETELLADEWTDPNRAKVLLGDYAGRWISERPGLRPRTVELYRWLLRKHIAPHIGDVQLGRLTTPAIRRWRADLLASGVSQSIAAKSYRLQRAVLATAVEEDRLIARNPCRVKGADRENPAERPVLTIPQVFALADAMRFRRFRALILLTAFATLRLGRGHRPPAVRRSA